MQTSDRKSSGDEETTVKSSSDTKDSKNIDSTNGPQRRASGSVAPIKNATLSDLSESKPLKMRLDSKPLPSIGKGLSSTPLPSIESLKLADEQLDDKRKRTEEAIRSSKEQLMEQRKKEEALRQKLSGVDPEEAQKRAEHMKRQRDLLIAKKKAEREQKVKAEEERKKKKDHEDELDLAENMKKLLEDHQRSDGADAKGLSDEAIAEMRRSTMRLALARRMKMDLIQSEEAKISAMQEEQFSELDKKLQQVEQLREDNRKREYILSKQLERQQAQIARNVKLSASQLDG